MQQGDHDTCPGGAYRVAKTDTASVDIYNISVRSSSFSQARY